MPCIRHHSNKHELNVNWGRLRNGRPLLHESSQLVDCKFWRLKTVFLIAATWRLTVSSPEFTLQQFDPIFFFSYTFYNFLMHAAKYHNFSFNQNAKRYWSAQRRNVQHCPAYESTLKFQQIKITGIPGMRGWNAEFSKIVSHRSHKRKRLTSWTDSRNLESVHFSAAENRRMTSD